VSSPDIATRSGGSLLRSDAAIFLARQIPTVYIWHGTQGKNAGVDIKRLRQDYVQHRYHQTSDVIDSTWDLGAAMQQVRVGARLAAALADSNVPLRPKKEQKAGPS
jgi:hypothetical protein